MPGFSRRGTNASLIPRVLLHWTVWSLAFIALRDVVPISWAAFALPVAAVAAVFLDMGRLRVSLAIAVLGLLPWVLRSFLLLAGLFYPAAGRALIAFDDGWFLMAPAWYLSAVLLYLATHRPRVVPAEILILGGAALLYLFASGDAGLEWTAPQLAVARGLTAVLVLVLGVLSIGMAAEVQAGSLGRSPKPRGRVVHIIFLVAAAFLLLFVTATLRRNRSLTEGGGVLGVSPGNPLLFSLSPYLSLEPEISFPEPEVTLLYREEGPPRRRLLRQYTLSGWDPVAGFTVDEKREMAAPGYPSPGFHLPRGPERWPVPELTARETIAQEYYLVALDPSSFLALEHPAAVTPWKIWDQASFVGAYGVESRVSVAEYSDLRDAGSEELPDGVRDILLAGGDDPFYRDLAEDITAGTTGDWEAAETIKAWLQQEFTYSLNPGVAPDGDQLRWFLTEGGRGYCTYFATAMTRLCRALGIPSRLAVGFFSDPDSATMGFVPVRADQAHAWTEVWFDDFGWISFDPTSSRLTPGEELSIRFISPDEWLPLIEEILSRRGEISVSPVETVGDTGAVRWWRRAVQAAARRPWVTFFVFFFLAFLVYLPQRVSATIALVAAKSSGDPRRIVIAYWRNHRSRIERAGYRRYSTETLLDWGQRVEGEAGLAVTDWAHLVLKAVFAPRFDDQDLRNTEGRRKEAYRAWRRLPIRRRLRAALSPGLGRRRRR